MSIETARIEWRRSPSSSKNDRLRPGAVAGLSRAGADALQGTASASRVVVGVVALDEHQRSPRDRQAAESARRCRSQRESGTDVERRVERECRFADEQRPGVSAAGRSLGKAGHRRSDFPFHGASACAAIAAQLAALGTRPMERAARRHTCSWRGAGESRRTGRDLHSSWHEHVRTKSVGSSCTPTWRVCPSFSGRDALLMQSLSLREPPTSASDRKPSSASSWRRHR